MTGLAGRRVLLGVAGGIAAYKSCTLVRRLVEAGALVDVVLSDAATRFVGAVTFEALAGRPVLASLWQPDRALDHVRLGQQADLAIVAPATADLLARLAAGIADDILAATLLARTAPLLLAPAMNDAMFAHPATAANLARLRERGAVVVGPATGALAEGPSDRPGRMSEPEEIVAEAERMLRRGGPLDGRRVLVTAGPTREPLDAVRVVTNRSSGQMGYALAAEAWARGADVVLLSGPVALPTPHGVARRDVETTADLGAALQDELPRADVLLMAAAPADYRAAEVARGKRPRQEGALSLDLAPTDDLLQATRASRKPGALMVGFALEAGDAVERARAKLVRKDLDLIVVNDALEPGAGPEVPTNRVTLVGRDGAVEALPLLPKREVAARILDRVERLRV